MQKEIFLGAAPFIIALLIIWLLYRIRMRIADIVKEKFIKDFPDVLTTIDNLQRKIDDLNSRVNRLERKIN